MPWCVCCLVGCSSSMQPGLSMRCWCAGNEEEWREWSAVGDPIMHIELRRWADCLVVAPLSANTLAKLAQGMSDNLLTCVVRLNIFGLLGVIIMYLPYCTHLP